METCDIESVSSSESSREEEAVPENSEQKIQKGLDSIQTDENTRKKPPVECIKSAADQSAKPNLKPNDSILHSLEDSIQKLPVEERVAYETVKRQAPDLIDKESPPLLFLKRHQFNTDQAALRLCTYWKLRFQAFSNNEHHHYSFSSQGVPEELKSNGILPLHQTGEGALNRSALALLSNGYYAILPPTQDDPHRTLILVDYSRIVKDDLLARIQLEFYFHQCILQNPKSQAPIILFMLSPSCLDILRNKHATQTPLLHSLVSNAFAYAVHSIHFCYKAPEHEKRIQQHLSQIVQKTATFWNATPQQLYVHEPPTHDNDFSSLHSALGPFGITKRSLPQVLGGHWSYDRFVTWQETRIRVEWELPLGALDRLEYGESYKAKALSELSPQDQVERKRRYNILHSRRKRRRDRVETDVVKREMKRLLRLRDAAKREERRLVDLLERAQRMAQLVSNGLIASDAQYVEPALLSQDFSVPTSAATSNAPNNTEPLSQDEDSKEEKWASALAASSRLRELQRQEMDLIRYRQQQQQQQEQQHSAFLTTSESLYPGFPHSLTSTTDANSTMAYLYQRQQEQEAAHRQSLAVSFPSPYLSHLLSQAPPSASTLHGVLPTAPSMLYDPWALVVPTTTTTAPRENSSSQQPQQEDPRTLDYRLWEMQQRRDLDRHYRGDNNNL